MMVPDAPPDHHVVVETLQRLIATCRESEEAYRAAASAASDPEQAAFFRLCSQQRASFGAALGIELERVSGVAPAWDRDGIRARRLPRATQSDASILEACRRHEDGVVRGWGEALRAPLPDDIGTLLRQQEAMVRATHGRLWALGTAAATARVAGSATPKDSESRARTAEARRCNGSTAVPETTNSKGE